MLVNSVTLKKRRSSHENFNKKIVIQDSNGFSIELVDEPKSAEVFRINSKNELVPFRIDPVVVEQEYEIDPFTPQQTKAYKEVLYSEQGRKLVNRLKNLRLMNLEGFKSFLETFKDKNVSKLGDNKFIKSLLEEPKKEFIHKRKLNFAVEDYSFNTISLKDLGITKQEVMEIFRKHKLITV